MKPMGYKVAFSAPFLSRLSVFLYLKLQEPSFFAWNYRMMHRRLLVVDSVELNGLR